MATYERELEDHREGVYKEEDIDGEDYEYFLWRKYLLEKLRVAMKELKEEEREEDESDDRDISIRDREIADRTYQILQNIHATTTDPQLLDHIRAMAEVDMVGADLAVVAWAAFSVSDMAAGLASVLRLAISVFRVDSV
ncbi:hypothetical protein COOONC_17870 [Cooperia oncophora]